MHFSMNPSADHLREGARIIAKPGYASQGGREILVVTSVKKGGQWQAMDRHGNVFEAAYRETSLKSATRAVKLNVFWTLPLPEVDDETALRWADVLSSGKEQPLLVHVTSIGEGGARGRLVATPWDQHSRTDMDGMDDLDCARYATRAVGHLNVTEQEIDLSLKGLPEGLAAGDLVCLHDWRNKLKDGVTVTKAFASRFYLQQPAATILAAGVREEDLPGLLPAPLEDDPAHFGFSRTTFATADVSDLAEEDAKAVARSEPDEALVLWFPEEDGKGTQSHVLGSTGYTFMMCDNVNDEFYGAGVEPGLWVMRRARWWSYTSHEGEHDAGIDGDWEPARIEDLAAFGFDEASLSLEIKDVLDEHGIDVVPNAAAEWIRKAHASLDEAKSLQLTA